MTRASCTISWAMMTVSGVWMMRVPLPYTTGSHEPARPRVMQRSHKLKSSMVLKGPSPPVPRGAGRVRASAVRAGMRPSAGSITIEV